MKVKRAIAAVGAATILALAGGGIARSEDLNARLQAAVKAQEWSQAVSIVDRLIDSNGATPELRGYRQQLIDLAGQSPQAVTTSTHSSSIDGIPLSDIAASMNQNLPLQMDDSTELVSARASGNRLIYTGRLVGVSAGDLDSSRFNSRFFKDSFTRIVCPKPDVQYVLERGIDLQYVLLDVDSAPLTTVDITAQRCQV